MKHSYDDGRSIDASLILAGRTLQLACEDAGSQAGWEVYIKCMGADVSSTISLAVQATLQAYVHEYVAIQGHHIVATREYDNMLLQATFFAEEYRFVLLEYDAMGGYR